MLHSLYTNGSTRGTEKASVNPLRKRIFKVELIRTTKVGINIITLYLYVLSNRSADTEQEKWVREGRCALNNFF